MITITIDIPVKKKSTVTTQWHITQNAPRPDINGECGTFRWRNFGGLMSSFGNPPTGIGNSYTACIDKNSEFQFRNNNLGKIQIGIQMSLGGSCTWKVRDYEDPKDSERALLDEYVKAPLLQAIEDHKEQLKVEAVQALQAHVHYEINEAKDRIERLTAEMDRAMKAL